jgi:Cdc6-like AAA superfamily ATPase
MEKNVGGRWSLEDDILLSRHANESIASLAVRFNRGDGAIRSRLKHINNPEHAAYKRLRGQGGPPSPAKSLAPALTNAVRASPAKPTGPRALVVAEPVGDRYVDESSLLPSQRAAVELVDSGENILLTGEAGTGKSYVVHVLVQRLRRRHWRAGEVVVSASTGVAAQHIGGVTLHSFAGVGLARGTEVNYCASDRWVISF